MKAKKSRRGWGFALLCAALSYQAAAPRMSAQRLAAGEGNKATVGTLLDAPAATALTRSPSRAEDVREQTLVAARPVFTESVEGGARLRTDEAGNIYLLNTRDSSVLVYDQHFNFLRRVGSIGQGPADLRFPSDFAVTRGGELVVADTLNNRVQILSQAGEPLGSFDVERPVSVDVLSSGEILVVANDKNLIDVFDARGRALRTIGELAPTTAEANSPPLHLFLNRGRLLVDRQDNVYWVGKNLPFPTVRKYSPQGVLLQEFHPASPRLEEVASRAVAGVQMRSEARILGASGVLNAISTDPRSGDVWLFPSAPQVLIYDGRGNKKQEFGMKAGIYPAGASDALILDQTRFIITNTALGSFLFERQESHN